MKINGYEDNISVWVLQNGSRIMQIWSKKHKKHKILHKVSQRSHRGSQW